MVFPLLTPGNYPKYTECQDVSERTSLPNKLGVLQRSLTTPMRLVCMRKMICLVEWAVLSVLQATMFWVGLLTWKVLVRFRKGYEGQDWDVTVSNL
jgi:hypothetical protein